MAANRESKAENESQFGANTQTGAAEDDAVCYADSVSDFGNTSFMEDEP
jgi:hypothetical protein